MDDSPPLVGEQPGPKTEPPQDDPSPPPGGAPISRHLQLGLVVTALTTLALGGTLGTWVCAAILSFLALETHVMAADALRTRWLPLLLVGSVFVALCGPLLLGHPPASRDHGIHYFQARTFVYDLLLEGRLRGWTDRINHGLPLGDSYPMLGYFLSAFLHIVSAGVISLRVSYALFMAALWGSSMIATGLLSARILRSIAPRSESNTTRLATWAGCLAALAWCIDPGSSREGGWNYLMFHGVWPQQLSVTFWLFALLGLLNIRAKPTARRVCINAALFGMSIIAHPFGLLATCVTIPALLVATVIADTNPALSGGIASDSTTRRFWAYLGVFIIAGTIAAGNVFILLQSEASMGRGPVPWKDLPTLAARMWSGELFQSQHPLVGGGAILGAILVLRRRSLAGILAFTLMVAIFLVGSRDALTVLRLDLVVPALKNVQFLRWSVFVKPLWYAFAGVGVVIVARGLTTWPHRDHYTRGSRIMLCALLGPLIAGGILGVSEVVSRPAGGLHTLENSRYGDVDASLKAALEEARASAPDTKIRVAFLRRGMSGGTYPLFALADSDADIVIDGHVPAINFERRVRSQDPGLLRSLGVTHVLYDRPLDTAPKSLASALETTLEAGEYTLARLRDSSGERIAHNAKLRVLEPHKIEVDVSRSKSIVHLPVAPYRKWIATQNGEELEISPVRFRRGLSGMELRPNESGAPIMLRYQEPFAERALSMTSSVAALLCLLGILFGPRLPTLPLTSRWPNISRRRAAYIVSAMIFAGGVLAYSRQGPQLIATWRAATPAWEERSDEPAPAVRDFIIEKSYSISSSVDEVCDGMKTRDAQADCVPRRARPHLSTLYASPYLYRCVRVQVPPHGWTEIQVPALLPNSDLVVLGSNIASPSRRASLELRTSATDHDWSPLQKLSRASFDGDQFAGQPPVIALQNRGSSSGTACLAIATVARPSREE